MLSCSSKEGVFDMEVISGDHWFLENLEMIAYYAIGGTSEIINISKFEHFILCALTVFSW
jgi:hypothetical protein